ncbi:MAG: undecaprenyl/decaprenyl-phosphate alpha-N-acetylglucosaminyl 1-phosphate transferase [Defluviitaleaceae bacterium]|nr:undecaprenyl/decaprenyl-phosphate alpha-N-acetylglucosaminyl 1-phosphate transferase [Defluviitaleaceae bacterium]
MTSYHWLIYLVAFLAAFSVSIITTPLAKKISIKLNAIDYPKKRGLHKEPMPRMGGLAIIFGFMAAMLVLIPFIEEFRTLQFLGFIVGAIIIVILGMIDDIKNLNSLVKFSVQIIAAVIVVITGTTIEMIMWPTYINPEVLEPFSVPFTILWILGVTNAVNLIDGVDGLAAGVSSICGFFLMILCILTGSPMAVVFTASLTGSSMGFLPRNFNPAEIYMGDTGATFLGYTLAVSSVMGLFKTYTLLAVIIAILSISFPILDTAFAMIRRLKNKVPLMSADRGHLHHRLIDMGYSQKQAVTILYILSAITGLIAILITIGDSTSATLGGIFLFTSAIVVYVYKKRLNKEKDVKNENIK